MVRFIAAPFWMPENLTRSSFPPQVQSLSLRENIPFRASFKVFFSLGYVRARLLPRLSLSPSPSGAPIPEYVFFFPLFPFPFCRRDSGVLTGFLSPGSPPPPVVFFFFFYLPQVSGNLTRSSAPIVLEATDLLFLFKLSPSFFLQVSLRRELRTQVSFFP